MTKDFLRWLPFALAAALLLPDSAVSGSLETLMMPGKVIQGHAKYEEQCSECHTQFSKTNQNSKCLACHKKIAGDIKEGKGYHGHSKGITEKECKQCHTEHLGRAANIVILDKETFGHDATDFPLKGAHTIIKCTSCHKINKKYRDTPGKCNDCHKEDDVHKGRLGKGCQKCHKEQSWSKARFDHDKTDFPLKAKHRETNCNGCHPNERYEDITTACYGCHQLEDFHNGRYGRKCHDCHTEKDWEETVFNHDKDTKYKLRGKHSDVHCDDCHRSGNIYKAKVGEKKCYGCHRNDDEHKSLYGKKCQDCHIPKDWEESRFDHDKDTDFKLQGKHKKARCSSCHVGTLYHEEDMQRDCYSCHKLDDVHKGEEGKNCQRCHNDMGWSKNIRFDHDLSRFPLIGLHATTSCEECHLSPTFKGSSMICVSCHKVDDVHKRRLGSRCAQCHNPNGWALWRFDHDTRTDYKIEGAHKKVKCHACHRWPVKRKISLATDCGSCHQQDDPHDSGFGQQCERCHDTKSFDHITFIRGRLPINE